MMQSDLTSSLATASRSASCSSDLGLQRGQQQSGFYAPSVVNASASMMEVVPNAAGPTIVDVRGNALPSVSGTHERGVQELGENYGYPVLHSVDDDPIAIDSDEEGQFQVRNPHPSYLPGPSHGTLNSGPCPTAGCNGLGHVTGFYQGHRCPKANRAAYTTTVPYQPKSRCPTPGCNGRGHVDPLRGYHRSLSGCPIAAMEVVPKEDEDEYPTACPVEMCTGTVCEGARAVPVPGPDGVVQSYYIACEHVPPPPALR